MCCRATGPLASGLAVGFSPGLLVNREEAAVFLESYAIDTSVLHLRRYYTPNLPASAVTYSVVVLVSDHVLHKAPVARSYHAAAC